MRDVPEIKPQKDNQPKSKILQSKGIASVQGTDNREQPKELDQKHENLNKRPDLKDYFKEYPIDEEGAKSITANFRPGVKIETLRKDLIATRIWGGTSPERGRFLTPDSNINIDAKDQLKDKYALPNSNTIKDATKWKIPQQTKILRGKCSPQSGKEGGGNQIFVPNPSVLEEVN